MRQCVRVASYQSFELSDYERYRATKFIAKLFINVAVLKMYVNAIRWIIRETSGKMVW